MTLRALMERHRYHSIYRSPPDDNGAGAGAGTGGEGAGAGTGEAAKPPAGTVLGGEPAAGAATPPAAPTAEDITAHEAAIPEADRAAFAALTPEAKAEAVAKAKAAKAPTVTKPAVQPEPTAAEIEKHKAGLTAEQKTAFDALTPAKQTEAVKEALKAAADARAKLFGAPTEYKYTLPDGMVADPKLQARFDPLAKELDLSQEGADKVANLFASVEAEKAKLWRDTVVGWGETASKDAEFGGEKYEENAGIARAAINKFGTPELKQVLNDYGLGNHPEFIRFCFRAGRALGEGGHIPGDGGGGSEKSAADVLYGPAGT